MTGSRPRVEKRFSDKGMRNVCETFIETEERLAVGAEAAMAELTLSDLSSAPRQHTDQRFQETEYCR